MPAQTMTRQVRPAKPKAKMGRPKRNNAVGLNLQLTQKEYNRIKRASVKRNQKMIPMIRNIVMQVLEDGDQLELKIEN